MRVPLRLQALLCPSLVLVAAGCDGSASSTVTEPHPTAILVSPGEFSVKPPCIDAPGGLRSYRVQLLDQTPLEGLPLNSDGTRPTHQTFPPSRITNCTQALAFEGVLVGRTYSADLEGFDVAAAEVTESTPARWLASCDDPARAETELSITIRDCAPWALVPGATPTPTEVTLSVPCSLPRPADAEDDDDVVIEQVQVQRDGVALGSFACDETFKVEGLTHGEHVTLAISAATADARALGTNCRAVALDGVSLPARCDAFRYGGALRWSVDDLTALANAGCDGTLESVVVRVVAQDDEQAEQKLQFDASNCAGQAQLDSLTPGTYSVEVSVKTAGSPEQVLDCQAQVAPGQVSELTCSAP